MNRKILTLAAVSLLFLYGFFLILGFIPAGDGKKLLPRYDEDSLVRISLNGGETIWERERDSWQFSGNDMPVDTETLSLYLSLPGALTQRPVADRSSGEAWLFHSDDIVFTDNKGKDYTLLLYEAPSWNVGEGEGIYVGYGDKIYRVKGYRTLSPGSGRDEINYFLLPRDLRENDIHYIALSTPLEGDAAASYNYRIEKDEQGDWYLGREDEQALFPQKVPAGKITLFINQLLNLKGDDLRPRKEYAPGNIRFSLDIRDNLGRRYAIDVGEKAGDRDEYYLVAGPESGFTYYIGRESLAGIAPNAAYLLSP